MILVEPSNFDSSKTRAFFTTKIRGSNLDKIEKVSNETGVPRKRIYLPIQKHTSKIHTLDSDFRPVVADAVITGQTGIMVGVLVADCVPVLLYDGVKRVIGAVHAGWKGTAEAILGGAIDTMREKYYCHPENMAVAIGPSIRQCSYEVDREVKDAVQKATGKGNYYHRKGNKYRLDLSSANRIQALGKGVRQQNIWQSQECTFCNPEQYHSYRYSKDYKGRQGGFIIMW